MASIVLYSAISAFGLFSLGWLLFRGSRESCLDQSRLEAMRELEAAWKAAEDAISRG